MLSANSIHIILREEIDLRTFNELGAFDDLRLLADVGQEFIKRTQRKLMVYHLTNKKISSPLIKN